MSIQFTQANRIIDDEFSNKQIVTINMIKKSDLWDIIPTDWNKFKARQIIWHCKNQIVEVPICQNDNCSKSLKWNADRNQYPQYCSAKCRARCGKFKKTLAESNLKSHGYNYSFQNPTSQLKRSKTMLEQYGYEFSFQNPDIHSFATNQNSIVGSKNRKQTLLKKYGVEHISHINMSSDILSFLEDKRIFETALSNMTPGTLASHLSVDRNTIIRYISVHDIDTNNICKKSSYLETGIVDIIKSINSDIKIEQNSYNIIPPFEIDIWLPELNLGIECNGDYWHSNKFKDKNYHFNKWRLANENNISLIQIFECDFVSNFDKVKALIQSKLHNKPKGIGGRKADISVINAAMARPFVDKYHLQNFVGGIHYGAFDNDTLIAVMTFGWTRGSRQSRRFELKRWVSDNKTHPGLFSKIFKQAQKDIGFNEIVSFSMNDWFDGQLYDCNQFHAANVVPPSYFYVWRNKRTHCSNFTKARIKQQFPDIFDKNLTEKEMMELLHIPCIWDSGKIEWIWKNC